MNSIGSIPFSRAASNSESRIFRDAFAMSTVPLIMAEIPVPDPPPVIATATSGLTALYASAHAWATFSSVSEPLFWMTARWTRSEPPPQAAIAKATNGTNRFIVFSLLLCLTKVGL